MALTIAVSGKGGTGKTTLSAMIIRAIIERAAGSVLAVDADPNSCLALTMGVEVPETIAGIREKSRAKNSSDAGMDRTMMFEMGIQQAISEAKGFDLLTMGMPEGPSCYCAANNLLRTFLDKLSNSYEFVLLDNEAGMEHLSRRTTNNVDLLFIVAEPTPIGQITAKRISQLIGQLPISVNRTGIIWNRSDNVIDIDGLDSFGCVPFDKAVLDCAIECKTIFDLASDSPSITAVRSIIDNELKLTQSK